MDNFYLKLERYAMQDVKKRIKRNHKLQLITFICLMMSIFSIMMHSKACWNYFLFGVFLSHLIHLIATQSMMKNHVKFIKDKSDYLKTCIKDK